MQHRSAQSATRENIFSLRIALVLIATWMGTLSRVLNAWNAIQIASPVMEHLQRIALPALQGSTSLQTVPASAVT